MKRSGKIILGSFFAIVGVLVFSQFQNCSPATGGSFQIGSAAFTVAAIVIQPTPVTPGGAYSATATLTVNNDANINCSWVVSGTTGQVASYPPTPVQGGVCYLQGGVAPASGTYSLTVTATDSTTNQTATSTVLFGAGGNQPPGTGCGSTAIPANNNSCVSVTCPAAPATCSADCASHAGIINSISQTGAQCVCIYACQ